MESGAIQKALKTWVSLAYQQHQYYSNFLHRFNLIFQCFRRQNKTYE